MAVLEVIIKNKQIIYRLALIAVLITLSLVIVVQFTPQVSANIVEIVAKIKQHTEITPYVNYSTEVDVLNAEELSKLAKEQPVVYAGLKPGLYQVMFTSTLHKNSLLVIYDNETDMIVRMFQINYI